MKPLKQNKADKAATNRLNNYQYKSQPKAIDYREVYEDDISNVVKSIENALKWGNSLADIRNNYSRHYKNGYEVFDQAMKIISSPLYEALNEGVTEPKGIKLTFNNVGTVSYVDAINKIVYIK